METIKYGSKIFTEPDLKKKRLCIILRLKEMDLQYNDRQIDVYLNIQPSGIETGKMSKNLMKVAINHSNIYTQPKKTKLSIPKMIYARALDNIHVAMKGKRIFERFWFNLLKQPAKRHTGKLVENFEIWLFPKDSSDWVNPITGESLTGYLQPTELCYLLNECINIKQY